MSQHDDFDRSIARWFDAEAGPVGTGDVLDRALRATRRRRPRPMLFAVLGSHWVGDGADPTSGAATLGRSGVRTSMALLVLLLALALVAGAVLIGARRLLPAPVDLGIFAPLSGRIVYGGGHGVWAVDPAAPADPATWVPLSPEPDVAITREPPVIIIAPLAWSSDGTRLLIEGSDGNLYVLRADGSETQLTERPMPIRGATISPDGSRVVFATIDGAGDTGNLFAVDADGGPAQMLLERDGLEGVSFSPDGRRIAYVIGRGDSDHRVWVMDADGTNGHQIVANDVTLGAGHDHGVAWSPAGDRIALGIAGVIYTFAPDGSDFTVALRVDKRLQPFWSPDGSQLETRGPWHPGSTSRSVRPTLVPSPSLEPTVVPSSSAATASPEPEAFALMNAFLDARVSGLGAEQYLSHPDDDIPLLYATTAGAPYERSESEPVPGIEWPYGWIAFKARLSSGDTVVEQLLFISQDGRRRVEYSPEGFGTDIAPTTEDGQAVAFPHSYFDGAVTVHAAHPWIFHDGWAAGRLIPQGPGVRPTTDGGERNHWDVLVLKADPAQVGRGCVTRIGPADAEAIAESIASNPDLEATAPVRVSDAGTEALMMDVVIAAGASVCAGDGVAGLDGDRGVLVVDGVGFRTGDKMRLYLFDAPEGSSMRVLAIAIIARESTFDRAVAAAVPVVSSIELPIP
jgi:WD40 repeat protein